MADTTDKDWKVWLLRHKSLVEGLDSPQIETVRFAFSSGYLAGAEHAGEIALDAIRPHVAREDQ